jgi:UDP-glucose 4-epimerase
MPGRILVVGRHSYLAQHFLEALGPAEVVAVRHEEIERPDLLEGIGCIVNFCRQPLTASDARGPEQTDADLRLARRIGGRDIAYVMLSSRKVYAPSDAPLSETSPTVPRDPYGRHKLAVEHALRDLIGERLTVLRLANVFGYERAPGRRTFVAMSLDSLAREGRIRYAMSPFVERDFLPVTAFADVLAKVVRTPPGGVLNVGSGIGLPAGRLALWILEGFGRGELVIASTEEKDAFVLDITRLAGLYGRPCTLGALRDACLAIGRRLAADLAQSSR